MVIHSAAVSGRTDPSLLLARPVFLTREGTVFRLAFSFDPVLVEKAKNMPFGLFDGETKTWTTLVCAQSVEELRKMFQKGLTDVYVDELLSPGENPGPCKEAILQPGTVKRPFVVRTATRNEALFARLRSIPGAQWDKNMNGLSYGPQASPALAELEKRGILDDPSHLLSPAANVIAYDGRTGKFQVRGDSRAQEAFDFHFPAKDVFALWKNKSLDVAFADEFSREMYKGELARNSEGLQPDGLTLPLFKHQAQNVAVAVERTGLGVYDAPGIGKCLHGDTEVWVNGKLEKIEDLFNKYAGETFQEGDLQGEWALPKEQLVVHAYNEKEKSVNLPVSKLFRQEVSENLTKVTLTDNTSIVLTKAHRLLGENGWTNKYKVGSKIAVPRYAPWEGEETDLELLEFFAHLLLGKKEDSDIALQFSRLEHLQKVKDLWHSLSKTYDFDPYNPVIIAYAAKDSSKSFCTMKLKMGSFYAALREELGRDFSSKDSTSLELRESVLRYVSQSDKKGIAVFLETLTKNKKRTSALLDVLVSKETQMMLRRLDVDATYLQSSFTKSVNLTDNLKEMFLELKNNASNAPKNSDLFWVEIKELEDVFHEGFVYDLEVPKLHNFVANKILCHNTATAIGTAVEVMLNRKEVLRTVIVVPGSVRTQWSREIARFVGLPVDSSGRPTEKVVVIEGDKKKRHQGYADAKDAQWMIVNYDVLHLDYKLIAPLCSGAFLVLDEAHRIKSPTSKRTKAARQLAHRASKRMALSGTPIENNVGEFFSIISGFVMPGCLGSAIDFLGRYSYPNAFGGYAGSRNLVELRERTKGYYVRHTKAEVATHLPPLRVQHLPLDVDPQLAAALKRAHREAGEEIKHAALERIGKGAGEILSGVDWEEVETGAAMTAVGMLRLMCSSPRLLHTSESAAAKALVTSGLVPNEDGPKLDELRGLALEMQAEKERLVVFTFSKKMAYLIADRLKEDGVRYVLFTGDTKNEERDAAVMAFTSPPTEEDPGPTVFIATDAGAEGLNLGKQCSTLVNFDVPWTPGRIEQRSNRIHRIDGTSPSYRVINMTMAGTIEGGILKMVELKADLQDAIFGEHGGRKKTTGRAGRSIFEDAMKEWQKED